jgi:tRNA A-37 threonylcarbamoyl transferase component Bud32
LQIWSVVVIEIGHSVGNYTVTAKLGEGGMGAVFLAEHPVIARKAALKAIHPQFSKNVEVVSRFITEAKAINEIGHDHIVDVTDFGTTAAGDFYFIMEYLDGRSLADVIASEGRLAPRRALHNAAQIADALQASHDHGVIHRDLKPDNIFLVPHAGDADFVKVLDFGLAKLFGTERRPVHNTRSGSVFGTPCYMAPEQCEGKVAIDYRADIYALGVILFEMLTGKVPFGGTGFGEIIVKHMTVPAPPARSILPELPPILDAVLFRALAKNPDHRFQSMAEFRAALVEPDSYATSLPPPAHDDDLSGRFRAAGPMVRTEISLRPTPVAALVPEPARVRHTTFTGITGEIGRPDAPTIPRKHYARNLLIAAGVAAAGLIVVKTAAYRRPFAGVFSAAQALSHPPTVRLNFGSDPDGATIIRSDGLVVGTTPLSTEVAYSDAPSEYVVRKPGYVSKSVSVVPNLPSPVFAVLQPLEPVAPPPVVSSIPSAAPVAPAVAVPRTTRRPPPRRDRVVRPVPAAPIDDDGVLAPTIQ